VGGRIRFALERFASPRHRSHVAQLFSLGGFAYMNTTETQVCRLESIRRRLTFVAKINLGLMLVLFVCCLVAYFLTLRLPTDPDQDLSPLHSLQAMLPWMLRLNLVCLGLLLLWGPALCICSFKIKKLTKNDAA
jgi:hypothetical protein